MFAIDDILISDEVLEAPFSCNLGACRGACCVQGESGAPLAADELPEIEQAFAVIEADLRPEARATIAREGLWAEDSDGSFVTTCVDGAECVFVVYDGAVAKCALQRAFQQGRIDFEKPVSCHLFPLREESFGGSTVLNYEQIEPCRSGVKHGRRLGVHLADFLRVPLTRRFGADWFDRFRVVCRERAADLAAASAR